MVRSKVRILSEELKGLKKELKNTAAREQSAKERLSDSLQKLKEQNFINAELHLKLEVYEDIPVELFSRPTSGYSEQQKDFAILHLYSPKAYEFIKGYLCLPSSRTIRSLTALSNCDITHPYLLSILTKQNNLVRKGKLVVFIWCPSHVGILGNEVADRLAKQALVMPVTKLPLPHTDYKSPIRSYVKSLWQNEWDEETDNKLHSIQPVISEWKQGPQIDRRAVLTATEVVQSRILRGIPSITE
ncbi:hypothetical protein CAPTEDRAFT_201116 [Capitella teleta]|uniref:THAP9-like helix-turn-helix domain-containing protein n=1 Tax=Capitella teleta TaxID=283909 RepID=R7VA67_CAPTE|nr:hypothetical protein CAPTEDRAFT_201116 [Capitella teleta]|eukprot:ELU15698.1 hypothetical protein CAPTEDRAFT_201116 [Capitella teleta]